MRIIDFGGWMPLPLPPF